MVASRCSTARHRDLAAWNNIPTDLLTGAVLVVAARRLEASPPSRSSGSIAPLGPGPPIEARRSPSGRSLSRARGEVPYSIARWRARLRVDTAPGHLRTPLHRPLRHPIPPARIAPPSRPLLPNLSICSKPIAGRTLRVRLRSCARALLVSDQFMDRGRNVRRSSPRPRGSWLRGRGSLLLQAHPQAQRHLAVLLLPNDNLLVRSLRTFRQGQRIAEWDRLT